MATWIEEKVGKLNELGLQQAEAFKPYKHEGGGYKGMPSDVADGVRTRGAEIKALLKEVETFQENEKAERDAAMAQNYKGQIWTPPQGMFGGAAPQEQYKSLGKMVTEHASFKGQNGRFPEGTTLSMEFNGICDVSGQGYKAFDEATGYAPPNYRLPIYVESAQRPGLIQNIIPTIKTSERNAVPFIRETTFTNNAGGLSEGSAATASVLATTAATQTIENIATYIEVTEQMLQDIPQVEGLVNNRLSLMMEQKVETQLISGNGSTPNLEGYLNGASVQTQALGTDDIYTAFAKAMLKVTNTAYYPVDYVVMNSAQYLALRTTKDDISNFIWGAPNSTSGDLLWGKPVISTDGITAGTGLVGSFRLASARYIAQGVEVVVGRINDGLVTFKQAIRINQREALVKYRTDAFCKVTGL